jgi:hypothetical protein
MGGVSRAPVPGVPSTLMFRIGKDAGPEGGPLSKVVVRMRCLVGLLVALGCTALFVGGAATAFVGFADQNVANHIYKVGFKHAGDECGAESLVLSIEDGAPLVCGPIGMPLQRQKVDFPGFTDAQNDEVFTLASELGSGGLSAAEQRQIQDWVDRLAAAVAPADRPQRSGLWGARLGWLGIGMVAISIVGLIALRQQA